ncbi:vWA domain-containing protein [Halpernia frigidisoli]|uniref:Ca-activated chloride channel family protein n=1 Tax=Halpernia frigidisoli TaxID=1125876 RepID=A0A1I3DXF2_9FLAO|nr:VWA domain-containing protein [Halpernia frigidisoli]SFH91365.1 Ca-activated chloride channel family protein [Halpernia frigidisoli]
MENNQNIDEKFKEASDSSDEKMKMPEFENIWNRVEEKLDKKDEKRILPVWFPYGIAASLLIGSGIFYFNSKNSTEIVKPQIAINKDLPTQIPISNPEIRKIDETIKSNIAKEKAVEKTKVIALQIPTGKKSLVIVKNIDNLIPLIKNKRDSLKEKNIEDVVLLGYGTQKREYLAGSIQSVSPEIKNYLVYTENTLQGKVAGVQISPSSGNPGNSPTIVIRGMSTLNNSQKSIDEVVVTGYRTSTKSRKEKNKNPQIQNNTIKTKGIIIGNPNYNPANSPLIVVDGVVYNSKSLDILNPNNIKELTVLKDASATSMYGNRGREGVILIKTKNLSKKEKKELQKMSDELDKKDSINIRGNAETDNEGYDAFIENPFESAKNEPLSTFSIDVDNAAYSNIRRMINNGEKVDKNAVRIEEMLNYFKYSYLQPTDNKPFSVNSEYSDAAWNTKHKLLKIGLQGKNIPLEKLPNSNIVFLIDVSGSMSEPNKLPLLKSSFKVLLDKLKPEDKVGIVVYAGNAGMVLEPTLVKNKEKIIASLDNLQAGGSTAGGAGIELAYKLAQEHFIKNGNNRVIIATDGDFNVGSSSTTDLGTLIEEKRKSGVFLTCLGFGMGNYKDNTLETLADKGNGNYAYIDNMQEANKFLGKEFAGNLYAIAKDVKIQIEFNPKYVKSYRLIGYENRKLQNEDFTNDKKDAGELGSGHTVTALYEIIPVGVDSDFDVKEIPLKYSKTNENTQNFGDELATIKLRYKKPDEDKSVEIQQIVKNKSENFNQTSPDFKFASAVSWFGLVLRDSKFIKDKNLNEIEDLAKEGLSKDEDGYRSEFIRLVESYKTIK